ncbi:hypothetical protein BKA63DRAFT_596131 [Paraphoma chrysanthemicola]|nr:hypothetical protein BKA63DRAFT_596131 [Paraphoma chrysanthemicola]
MPPKKKAASPDDNADGSGTFRWTLENERKLLILTQGRYLTADDYERLVTVFPGTNLNGVKIRTSRLRVEQRNMYEQLGWTLPEGGATKKAGTKKRGAADDEGVGGENGDAEKEKEKPAKKARAKKAKKEEKKADEEKVESETEGDGQVIGVKQEVVEDEI